MATAGDLYTQTVAAVDAIAGSQIGSQHRRDVALPTGTNDFQVRVDPIERTGDFSNAYTVAQVQVTIARDCSASEATARASVLTVLEALLVPSFWKALAAVRDFNALPFVSETIDRNGNVLTATVQTTVVIAA